VDKDRRRELRRRRVKRLVAVVVAVALAAGGAALWWQPLLGSSLVGAAKVYGQREQLAPLEVPPLPQRSQLLAADGSLLATVYLEDRVAVPYDQVAQVMVDAIVSSEDRRFFEHDGVDSRGVARAAVVSARGEPRQGGSTITQQYVKNLLALGAGSDDEQRDATAPTFERKLRELWYALDLERRQSKDEILAGYLNTVFFGAQAYGVSAASNRFFSTTPDRLTASQAATLAALVRRPSELNPLVNPAGALEARNRVLSTMVAAGRLDPAAAEAARAEPLGLAPSVVPNGCAQSAAPFFCQWVRSTLVDEPILGDTPQERQRAVALGGLTITTTLSLRDQFVAQLSSQSTLGPSDRVAVAVTMVEPGTGKVLAMGANRAFGLDESANQTTVVLNDRPYQVGSTFKAFTLAAALEAGLTLDTRLPGGASYTSRVLDNPPSGSYTNSEGGASDLTLARATEDSVNTAFVQLTERVGVRNVAETARRTGLRSLPLDGPGAVGEREGSLTLGAREQTPLEMASAYATFAARGRWCPPTGVASVVTADGRTLTAPERCEQVLDPAVADTVTSLLVPAVATGTGTAAQVPGRAVAGKTGTTQNHGAAWFVGYTPDLSTSVWVGTDVQAPRGRPICPDEV